MSSKLLPPNDDDALGGQGGGGSGSGMEQAKPTATRKVNKRTCSIVGCKNGVVQGGVCVTHGAKRRLCRFPGCEKNAKCAGLCSKHGPPRKKCEAEGCNNVAVQAGKCKAHGATSKKCDVPGCTKLSVTGGVCKRHRNFVVTKTEDTTEQPGDNDDFPAVGFCVPTADNPGPNQEALQRAQAEMFSNFAMRAPGGLAAYAMSMNPMAYNPMMAAAMGMNFGYGYQMDGMEGNNRADADGENQEGTGQSLNRPTDDGDHSFNHPTEGNDEDVKVPAIPKMEAKDEVEV